MNLSDRLQELEHWDQKGLRRHLPQAQGQASNLLQFSSNDYLGLSRHPEVIEAAIVATRRYGCGATGSRLLSGNWEPHEALEAALASFKGTEKALLFNSGYSANLGILGGLVSPGDLVVGDKLNHASLIDAARNSGGEARFFRHGDWERAKELLEEHQKEHPEKARWLALDGVFSMDGYVVDLPRALEIAHDTQSSLLIDDAHSTGVLGETGRGTFEHFGLKPEAETHGLPGLIVMGTLSKALGSAGAFAATDSSTRELLLNRARPFVFSTALPPAVAAASLASLRVLEREPGRVRALTQKARAFRQALERHGAQVPQLDPTPIVPVALAHPERALSAAQRLRERAGIVAMAVRPPTVPPGTSRLRCTVTLDHSDEALEAAARAIATEVLHP